jgi:cysteine desulfurase/selenocysteine lyase
MASSRRRSPSDLRGDFPVLAQRVNGRPLVYFDNAATTQKPRQVIEAMSAYYLRDNANVHRGVHTLSERATAAFEGAREKVRAFLNAESASEIVFTRGTTEAINLVAKSFPLGLGDEVLVSHLEHHSNLVPWQQTGATVRVARGEPDFNSRTKLFAFTQMSNAIGTVTPAKEWIAKARKHGVPTLLDGAQAAAHFPIDVRDLDCDFYAFSGHKLYGPMGIGVLYGKRARLDALQPWQSGGEMVSEVFYDRSTWQEPPHKFEAGTPDVAAAIGLGAAIDYLRSTDRAEVAAHERELRKRAESLLGQFPEVKIVGSGGSIVSFNLGKHHPHDVGTALDERGIAVRTGHLCAQPLLRSLGVSAVVRLSFGLYNLSSEVDELDAALRAALATLGA